MDMLKLIIRLITSSIVYVMLGVIINFGYNFTLACIDLYNKSTGKAGADILTKFNMSFDNIISFEPTNTLYYVIGFLIFSKFLILDPILDFIHTVREKSQNGGKLKPKFKGQSKSGVDVDISENKYTRTTKRPSDILKEQTLKELGEGDYKNLDLNTENETKGKKGFLSLFRKQKKTEVLEKATPEKTEEIQTQQKPKNSEELYEENYDELMFGDVFVNDANKFNKNPNEAKKEIENTLEASKQNFEEEIQEEPKIASNPPISKEIPKVKEVEEIDEDEDDDDFTFSFTSKAVIPKEIPKVEEVVVSEKVEPTKLNSIDSSAFDTLFEDTLEEEKKEPEIIPISEEDFKNDLYNFSEIELKDEKPLKYNKEVSD